MAKMTNKEKVENARKQTVKTIIEMMENKGLLWVQEWGNAFGDGSMPRNGATGRWYSGGNTLHLMAKAYVSGWKDPRWFTHKQAREIGYFPRKGEKGTLVEYYKPFEVYLDADGKQTKNKDEAESVAHYMRLAGIFWVFNAEQMADADGNPMPAETPIAPTDEDELDAYLCDVADILIESSRCEVREIKGEMRAFYRPSSDFIQLPSRTQFTGMESFITTLAHEMTHSTGGVLKRKMTGHFGDADYAFEELVAELGSTFVAMELGIHRTGELEADENFKNHAAYLKGWLKALKSDTDYIFKAASQAGKAASYIIDRYNGKEEIEEQAA